MRRDLLTDLEIRNAQPILKSDGTDKDVWRRDGVGLYLQITGTPSGQISKYWLYRYSVKGKDRRLGLGSYPTVSLADARRLAEQARRLRKEQRLDPIAERRRLDQERELKVQKAALPTNISRHTSLNGRASIMQQPGKPRSEPTCSPPLVRSLSPTSMSTWSLRSWNRSG
jgi:hypothetical protein